MNRPNEHRTPTRRHPAVAWQRYLRWRSLRVPLVAAVAAAGLACVVLLSLDEVRPHDDPWSGAGALARSEEPNRFQSLIVELNAPAPAAAPAGSNLAGGATAGLAGMGIRHDQASGGLDAIADGPGTLNGCRPATAPIAPDAPGGPHAASDPSDPHGSSDSDDSTSDGTASIAGTTPRDVAEASSPGAHLVAAGSLYRRATDHPLSTFSVDVDTASYSTVRRHLLAGRLPPAEAVRVEELLNYFPYDDPHPSEHQPVAIHGEVGRAPWAPSHRLVRLALTAREVDTRARPAMNLVFLIDVSGSMSHPQKLPLLIASLRLLVGQLEARDRVGIVVYAGAAGVVLPPVRGDAHAEILAALDRLHAGGPTHGGAGIELAYELASAQRIAGGVNRVVLATDGDFNVGVTDHEDLVRLIRSRAQRGVFLTALGFGIGQGGDARLEALADRGDGSYAYIDSLREARKVLVDALTGSLVTVAKDVKIQVAINPARVHAYRLIGYANRRLASEDFENDRKDAGDLGASQTVTALYEIVPQGIELSEDLVERGCPPEGSASITGWGDELMRVDVRYQPPEGGASTLVRERVIDTARDFESASVDFRFAAAVALFGMGLSGAAVEPDALGWSLATAEAIASRSLGADPEGHRHELRDLVARARAAAAPSTARLELGGDPAPL